MKTFAFECIDTPLSSMVSEIELTGEPIVIYRNGKPVADIVPHHRKSRLTPDAVVRQITIGYDPIEPLTDEEWPETE